MRILLPPPLSARRCRSAMRARRGTVALLTVAALAGCGSAAGPGGPSQPSGAPLTPCPSVAAPAAAAPADPARLVLTGADLPTPGYTLDSGASGPAQSGAEAIATFKGADKSEFRTVVSTATIAPTSAQARATQLASSSDVAGRPGAKTAGQACDVGSGAVAYALPPDSTSKLNQLVVLWVDGAVLFELRAGLTKEPGSTEVTDLLKLARVMDARAKP